jgi:hypothetical protein
MTVIWSRPLLCTPPVFPEESILRHALQIASKTTSRKCVVKQPKMHPKTFQTICPQSPSRPSNLLTLNLPNFARNLLPPSSDYKFKWWSASMGIGNRELGHWKCHCPQFYHEGSPGSLSASIISIFSLLPRVLLFPWRCRWQFPQNRWYLSTRQYGVTSQMTVIFVLTAFRTSDFTNDF